MESVEKMTKNGATSLTWVPQFLRWDSSDWFTINAMGSDRSVDYLSFNSRNIDYLIENFKIIFWYHLSVHFFFFFASSLAPVLLSLSLFLFRPLFPLSKSYLGIIRGQALTSINYFAISSIFFFFFYQKRKYLLRLCYPSYPRIHLYIRFKAPNRANKHP